MKNRDKSRDGLFITMTSLCILAVIAGICLGMFLSTSVLIWITAASIIVAIGVTCLAGWIYWGLGSLAFGLILIPSASGLACLWLTRLLVWLG